MCFCDSVPPRTVAADCLVEAPMATAGGEENQVKVTSQGMNGRSCGNMSTSPGRNGNSARNAEGAAEAGPTTSLSGKAWGANSKMSFLDVSHLVLSIGFVVTVFF